MSCKIKLKKENNVPILRISGDMEAPDVNNLTKKLESLSKSKHPVIVVDLTDTNYIDSHGLGVFVYAWKTMESSGHELVFLNPQGFVRSMFQETNLNQILRVIDNLEEL